MRVLKAFIKLRCAFSRLSHWGSMHMQRNRLKLDASGRAYELDSCIPVSRLTMNCSWMSLRKSQALCIPHENGGASQAFCTPMMRIGDSLRLFALFVHPTHENCGSSQAACTRVMFLPTVSGCLRFLSTPFRKIAGRLRLPAPP